MRNYTVTNCFGVTESFYTEGAANYWLEISSAVKESRERRLGKV